MRRKSGLSVPHFYKQNVLQASELILKTLANKTVRL
jgi:hypothetical protein